MAAPFDPRTILDALDEPALIVSDGRVSVANGAALAMLGRDIVGRDHRLAIRHPELLATLAAGRRADLSIVGVGGADRPWQVAVRPLGGARGCLVRFVDRSDAIAAERMRVDFVANASHELRTPLATISGYAETLCDPEIPEPLRRRFVDTIAGEAARMLRIIENLMSLSRIEAGRFIAPDRECDLAELCRAAVDQVAPLAERHGCPVALELEQAPIVIAGDPAQLLQLLDNLLSNAIRYGGEGIVLRAGVERGQPTVQVRDSGPGIAAIHLPRLTERFYRIDEGRSRGAGGTGLGLAIVKHIAERHRATLDIRSNPGEGTSVTVRFSATDVMRL